MKIENVFEKWYNGEIDETILLKQNQSLFDDIDNELKKIYFENILMSSIDIILCNFDFENVHDVLYDLFNDNIDKLTNDIIECVKKYKNVGVKYE